MNWYSTYIPNPHTDANPYRGLPPRQETLPTYESSHSLLPQPIWEGHEPAIACYWKVWDIAFRNLKLPNEQNGFVSPFIDTAFNGNLFMWDSALILMFARYARRVFNFQQTLDNFYAKQHPDGFICREIRETDGADAFTRFDPPATGPDIMPWAEWEYYLNFGDRERLARVFSPLLAFHQWMRRYRTWQDGTYWACGWACGMDNQPRLSGPDEFGPIEFWDNDHMTWVDTSFQAVFSAQLLIRMADELGRGSEVDDLHAEVSHLSHILNTTLWDENTGFYYDRRADGSLSDVKTIGAFWSLLAGIVPAERLSRLVDHLNNPNEFNRPHRIPSLSADHSGYFPWGGYWRGGVWAPTNYMVLRGLTQNGYHDLAHEIGLNHHTSVVEVFEKTGTVWENYAPETIQQGEFSHSDFVGWTGLSPTAVLFEYVFGIRPAGKSGALTWDVRLLDGHGVSQYPFGSNGLLDLYCAKRSSQTEKPVITAHANLPVTLEILWQGGRDIMPISP